LQLHVVDHGLDELAGQSIRVIGHRGRGKRTHTAGVRTGVAIGETFVVLGEGQWLGDVTVTEREQRAFRSAQSFLEHDAAAVEKRSNGGLARLVIEGNDHALPAGETGLFDHDRALECAPPLDRVLGLLGRVEGREGRRGDVQFTGYPSRERFVPLEPCRRPRRAECHDADRLHRVDQTGGERHLRSDDDEIDLGRLGEGRERRNIVRSNGHLLAGGGVVARGDEQPPATRRSAHRPRECVLAGTTADDQDVDQPVSDHASTPSKLSLPCASATSIG
jgi:hypothetical protein